jgi:microcystin-dependent protein
MSNPFIGEIRMFGGNFAPLNWAFCNGALIAISQNDALFNLIGTTNGGDGTNTFALPNLQSRVPVHMGTASSGTTYLIGQQAGVENVTLLAGQIPSHTHALMSAGGTQTLAPSASTILATSATSTHTGSNNIYGPAPPTQTLNPAIIKNDGGSQPHSNLQPYLAVNFIISLSGVFPSRN